LAAGIGVLALSSGAWAQSPSQNSSQIVTPGVLPTHWLSQDSNCMEIPDWQVAEYNPTLFLLRQSPCTDYEKPFIFLIFGRERALLLDTGSENGNLAPSLLRTLKMWLARTRRQSMPLIVVHTHEHGDHIAGDGEVQALRDPAMPVTFVPAEVEATKRFYGITHWPEEIGHVDLGGRVLDLIPVPGHSAVSVALYDRQTGILFSGDTLYPGRLYIGDFPTYQSSIERLVRFTADKPVAHIIGNHIEQSSTPFSDYPVGTIFQPNEHSLPLSRGSLLELHDGLHAMQSDPQRRYFRDFSIWPVLPDGHMRSPEEVTRVRAYIEEQKRSLVDPPSNHKEAH
jgi:glyoxylase-like metal-dependent hydrolase (beta-lactamase superfamily II)